MIIRRTMISFLFLLLFFVKCGHSKPSGFDYDDNNAGVMNYINNNEMGYYGDNPVNDNSNDSDDEDIDENDDNDDIEDNNDKAKLIKSPKSDDDYDEYINGDDSDNCDNPSLTTASGNIIKKNKVFCSGDLIFEDNFGFLDFDKWQHENTLAGEEIKFEFQWYTNNRSNSFIKDGSLHIRPTLTSDLLGEEYLSSGEVHINWGIPADGCTNPSFLGCVKTGSPTNIINPVRSALLRSANSFSFKFGKVQIRAKLPNGDWLHPGIHLLPKHNVYGPFPASGEIDMLDSRGNPTIIYTDGSNIGSPRMTAKLQFGPYPAANGYPTAHFGFSSPTGESLGKDFHVYELLWSLENITFKIDDTVFGNVKIGEGFWKRGGFADLGNLVNPWQNGLPVAPFDEEFYITIGLAVGGTFFLQDAQYPDGKPWQNDNAEAATSFWNNRDQWLPKWNLDDKNNDEVSLIVDYIRVFAL